MFEMSKVHFLRVINRSTKTDKKFQSHKNRVAKLDIGKKDVNCNTTIREKISQIEIAKKKFETSASQPALRLRSVFIFVQNKGRFVQNKRFLFCTK